MPSVTFIAHDGASRQVNADSGSSVMQAAVANGITGIIGDCGGACACATCHCYIDPEWFGKLPPPEAGEQSMLEYVIGQEATSRLSCQIKLSDELDGLVVRMPASQY